jgi:hypothetical protein
LRHKSRAASPPPLQHHLTSDRKDGRLHFHFNRKEIAMKAIARSILAALVAACFVVGAAYGQAPAGSSGSCKDGTFTTASSKRGACSGHGGVNNWYSDQQATAPSAAPPPPPSPAPRSTTTTAAPAEQTGTMRPTTAPGGGSGKVWVNTSSKVYHCPGDQWYGKTEKGSYMTEAAAKSQGDRPAYNKACGG